MDIFFMGRLKITMERILVLALLQILCSVETQIDQESTNLKDFTKERKHTEDRKKEIKGRTFLTDCVSNCTTNRKKRKIAPNRVRLLAIP